MKINHLFIASLVYVFHASLIAGPPSERVADTADTVSTSIPNPDVAATGRSDDLVLEEIEIKGKVEKPGVYMMPKRIEPEVEEMELGRSFQNELKDGVRVVPKPDTELGEVDKINSITKAVGRKRN